jgi:hypothetical protein
VLHTSRIRAAAVAVAAATLLGAASAGDCPTATGPDIIAGEIAGAVSYAAQGDLTALAFGTTACNVGDAEIGMVASTNDHDLMAQALYRLRFTGGGTRFEQVGLSWVRHGFFALSGTLCCSSCSATDGTRLGIGCSDPFSASRNGAQAVLGPRWQVDAYTGAFPYPPASPPYSGTTARRLQVLLADLEPTGSTTTRYFGEAQYLTPDDSAAGNQHNNASYREVLVSGSGSSWTFALTGPTVRERAAIEAWGDVDPAVSELDVALPGEGRLVLALAVTDLGGTWHYEYALYNMNSDDAVRSFSVPVPGGVTLTNVGFHDVEHRDGDGIGGVSQDGTDWSVSVAGGAITWSTATFAEDPNGNALRWGTTYNFRFDADAPPQPADVDLGLFKSGGAYVVTGAQGPAPVGGPSLAFCTDSDGAAASCPCGNAGAPGHGCDVAQATGGVQLDVAAQQTTPANRATLVGQGFPPSATPTAIVLRGTGLDSAGPVAFGDGLRCVSTPLVRLAATFATGGASTHVFGHGAGPGTFTYQVWFRNQPAMYCTPEAFNLSSGRTLGW